MYACTWLAAKCYYTVITYSRSLADRVTALSRIVPNKGPHPFGSSPPPRYARLTSRAIMFITWIHVDRRPNGVFAERDISRGLNGRDSPNGKVHLDLPSSSPSSLFRIPRDRVATICVPVVSAGYELVDLGLPLYLTILVLLKSVLCVLLSSNGGGGRGTVSGCWMKVSMGNCIPAAAPGPRVFVVCSNLTRYAVRNVARKNEKKKKKKYSSRDSIYKDVVYVDIYIYQRTFGRPTLSTLQPPSPISSSS